MLRPRAAVDEFRDPHDPLATYPQRVAVSQRGMVATAQYRATEAGASMLAAGGNAMDAAVAAAFALGVCEPQASGLGGQTMMLVYDAANRRKIALDGSSRAPHRIEPGELPREVRLRGHKATTVPSTPAVLAYALEAYGTRSLAEVLKPAIEMAEQGFRVTRLLRSLMRREITSLRSGTAAPYFLRKSLYPQRLGAVLKQPRLAATLARLAEAGVVDFYQGEIARLIHEDMVRNDGYLRDDDLAQIPWPIERRPLTAKFNDLRVFTMPPPGAGTALVEALNIIQALPPQLCDPDTPGGALLLAEVIRKANEDRSDRPYDPNLHPQLDEQMTRTGYAKEVARNMCRRLGVRGETTHLSVMDAAGNVVALTQSIERVFGSCTVTPELGFLYNDYMSAFDFGDMKHPYYLRPNAVPWASVAPSIVFRGRSPWLAIGSPGSERIVSAILQVLLRLQAGRAPFEAVDAPRLHCSEHGRVSLELARMRDDIPALLASKGFEIDEREPYSFYLGCVALVMRGRRGELTGIADPRRDGSAAGPRP